MLRELNIKFINMYINGNITRSEYFILNHDTTQRNAEALSYGYYIMSCDLVNSTTVYSVHKVYSVQCILYTLSSALCIVYCD